MCSFLVKSSFVVLLTYMCCVDAKHVDPNGHLSVIGNEFSAGNSVKEIFDCLFLRSGSSTQCVIDRAERALDEQKEITLAEADAEFILERRSKGVARGSEETPSALTLAVTRIIGELSEILSESISSLFSAVNDDASAKDGNKSDELQNSEEDDEDDDVSEEKIENTSITEGNNGVQSSRSRDVDEGRGKKKKKKKAKLRAIIKLLVIGAVIKAKLTMLLKILSAKLQIKFFLIALAGLLLNAARFWLDLKKGHSPQKVIYYEHAQHQHHYDGGEEEYYGGGGSGGSGSWGGWGRSDPQEIAYKAQKPQ